jgi:hypothetical protein
VGNPLWQTKALRLNGDYAAAAAQLEEILNFDSAAPSDRAKSATEYYRLVMRLWKQATPDQKKVAEEITESASEHDLYAEALLMHERGKRQVWRRVNRPSDHESNLPTPSDAIRFGCNKLEEAARLRWLVGDIDGLCATTNVLSESYLGLADWYRCLDDADAARGMRDRARDALNISRQAASSHKLGFPIFASTMSLVHLQLRFTSDEDHIDSKEIRSLIEQAKSWSAEQSLEYNRAVYLETLLNVYISPSFNQALDVGGTEFAALASSISSGASPRTEFAYLGIRASFNAHFCQHLAGGLSQIELERRCSGELLERPNWAAMVKWMIARGSSVQDGRSLVRTLLPPLPGMA